MQKGTKIYSQIWNHFQMLPCKTRARCFHCQKTITCFRHGTSNCKRHLARKHPNFYNGKEYIKFNPLDEETLDDGDDDGGNYEPSINDETSQNEEEYTITEMQFVDCPESKKDALEKAGLSKQSNEMTRAVKRAHDQGAKEELDDSRESKAEQVNESFLRGLMSETDLSLQGTLYATNVAMQLDNLPEYQRIVAEKLISDVIYNAKLESLCEDSMVVVRVGTFEHDAGEMDYVIQGTISPNDGQGDHDGNENGVDYQELSGGGTLEVIEQIIPDDPYLSDDGNSRADTDSNVQLVEYYSLQEPGEEVLELARSVKNSSCREIKGELVSYQKGSKVPVTKNVAGGNNQRSSLQNNSRSSMDGMKAFCNESKVGVRSTVFATNIALELESMNPRQKIIAEKLISDVLYHAKLGALTEHAMVVGRSAVFDYDHGFDRQF
ncbi:uncharacterized protein LOC131293154 [Anopheles ziemanni]|uniref:uncharacterized protein LOC131293154 n=1 Tax=Anopheles ziemanni TaxID=345580 RepID=UPI00266017FD|nr:uncharacterized protein LOC131293154 [Anopheles ziemanni]